MEIRLAGTGDTAGWLALVEQVRDSFPGLESREAMEEHRKTVLAHPVQKLGLLKVDNLAVGTEERKFMLVCHLVETTL